jgi:hypothetical protein
VVENIDTVKKNREALLVASKEVGLDINPESVFLMSRSQRIRQKHSTKVGNMS